MIMQAYCVNGVEKPALSPSASFGINFVEEFLAKVTYMAEAFARTVTIASI